MKSFTNVSLEAVWRSLEKATVNEYRSVVTNSEVTKLCRRDMTVPWPRVVAAELEKQMDSVQVLEVT